MKNELRSRWQVITAVAHHFTYVLCTYPSFANTNPRGAEHGFVWDLDSLFVCLTIFAQDGYSKWSLFGLVLLSPFLGCCWRRTMRILTKHK